MPVSPVIFPRVLLKEQRHSWNLTGIAVYPGRTGSAKFPIVRLDGGGHWEARLEEIVFSSRLDVLHWRAVRTRARGGVVPMVVPRMENAFAPFAVTAQGRQQPLESNPYPGPTNFDDTYTRRILATTSGAAVRRSTTMVIQFTAGSYSKLRGGEVFSIQHAQMNWRMYEIKTVDEQSANVWQVTFSPPLREATVNGQLVDFDRPRCLMRLSDPQAMDLRLSAFPYASPGVSFIEVFPEL